MRVRDPETGKTFFAKRRRRYDEEGSPRELTFCCFRRYRFLTTERTRNWFAEPLRQKRRQWPVGMWAYVIMPEHVHLLLATPFPLVRACHPTGRNNRGDYSIAASGVSTG